MAEGFWELTVQTYLCIDRGLFVNSQYLIGELRVWEASSDFLAIDFPKHEIWMVEVTTAPASKLQGKLTGFEKDYLPRIKQQLIDHCVVPDLADDSSKWEIGLWLYVPDKFKSKLEQKLLKAEIRQSKVTSLEEVAFPNWDDRFR